MSQAWSPAPARHHEMEQQGSSVPSSARRRPVPRCPIRPQDACSLCMPGVAGPHDCGLVYLVQDDPEMAAELAARRSTVARRERLARHLSTHR